MNILINLISLLLVGAVLEGGIFGKARNKLGNVVLFVWKGINAARSYAIPSNPNSTSQQTQRGIMKSMITYCQASLIPLIHKYWDPFAVQMSGYNLFIKTNRKPGTGQVAWTDHIITKGSLPNVTVSAPLTTTSTHLDWDSESLPPGVLSSDKFGVVLEKDDGSFQVIKDNVLLSAETILLGSFSIVVGTKYYYFTYREVDGTVTHVSNSTKGTVSV